VRGAAAASTSTSTSTSNSTSTSTSISTPAAATAAREHDCQTPTGQKADDPVHHSLRYGHEQCLPDNREPHGNEVTQEVRIRGNETRVTRDPAGELAGYIDSPCVANASLLLDSGSDC